VEFQGLGNDAEQLNLEFQRLTSSSSVDCSGLSEGLGWAAENRKRATKVIPQAMLLRLQLQRCCAEICDDV
jgi:hypothetical protein